MRSFSDIYWQQKQQYSGHVKKTFDAPLLTHRFFFRPLSFFLSTVFIFFGFSANQVTILNIFVLIAASIVAFSDYPLALLGSSLLYLLFYLLDFADGNIARYHQNSSFFGKFLDGAVDTLGKYIFAVLGFAFYLKSDRSFAAWIVLTSGASLSSAIVFIELIKYRIHFFSHTAQLKPGGQNSVATSSNELQKTGLMKAVKLAYQNISEFSPFLLICSVYLECLGPFFIGYFILVGFFSSAEIVFLFRSQQKYFRQAW